jgi:hypothetical protein
MADSPKLPPARVARAVDAVRRRLRRFEQKLVPPANCGAGHDGGPHSLPARSTPQLSSASLTY